MKKLLLAVLTFYVCQISAQTTLNTSLTACYSLNNNANDPISGLNGTVSAVTPTVNRFNSPSTAYYFNGSSHIRLPDNPLLKPANAVSFALWVKPTFNGGTHIIYTRNNLFSD